MAIRPQPAHIKWPFDEKTAEGIEKNFRTLFQDTKQLSGIVPVEQGGTGQSAFNKGDVLYAPLDNTVDGLAITATAGRFLRSDSELPEWSTLVLPNAAAQGDILYSNATDAIVTLAKDTNATRYLSNTGTSNNPAWAQVNLANGVTGTLPVGNGGSGSTTFTAGSVIFSNGTILTQDNANFFWDDTNNRLGLGSTGPAYRLDVRRSGNGSVARFSAGSATEGAFIVNFDQSGFHGSIFSNNADFDGSQWLARHTAASAVDMGDGLISFMANSGLVAGNSFSPTARGRIYPSGGASFLGTLSDPGSGVFRIDGSLTLTTALTVANGGTGRASHTAYAVICGGTGATTAQQSIASVGTAGQVLTSNGAGALPTFEDATGGGGTVDEAFVMALAGM